MLQPIYTRRFKKDVQRARKREKDLQKLKSLLLKILSPLEPQYRDHWLKGDYISRKECHIEPDWLLIYKPTLEAVIFERTGSHADLF